MGVIDEVLQANRYFAMTFSMRFLSAEPAKRLAVLSCMDARTPVKQMLGLRPGDAHILRNAGGIVTEDVLRSLAVSHHLRGTKELMIINHTDCGMMRATDEELYSRIRDMTGRDTEAPRRFFTFTDWEANVREQMQKVTSHPWFQDGFVVRGFLYDVETGRLKEVSP
jgi:carbonic anhydrase